VSGLVVDYLDRRLPGNAVAATGKTSALTLASLGELVGEVRSSTSISATQPLRVRRWKKYALIYLASTACCQTRSQKDI
jgi:hypothetical protein